MSYQSEKVRRKQKYDYFESDVNEKAKQRFYDCVNKKDGTSPSHVKEVYDKLQAVAGLCGFEIIGLRDRRTGKEYKRMSKEDVRKALNKLERGD